MFVSGAWGAEAMGIAARAHVAEHGGDLQHFVLVLGSACYDPAFPHNIPVARGELSGVYNSR